MKQLFKEIYTQLSTLKDLQGNPAYIRMWNNQLKLLWDGRMEMFQTPAVFIAFQTAETNTLVGGEGVQLYNPLIVDVHILYWQLDAAGNIAGDGTFEQNLDVFDYKQSVYKLLQKFKASLSSPFTRVSETQDYEHEGVYHFIQRYVTTWTDADMQEPVGGGETQIPLGIEIDLKVQESQDPDELHIYRYALAQYQFDNAIGGNPAQGKYQLNNASPALATILYLNNADINNIPVGDLLEEAEIGDTIKILKDANNLLTYTIANIEQTIGQTNFTVVFVSATGTINNGDAVKIIIL